MKPSNHANCHENLWSKNAERVFKYTCVCVSVILFFWRVNFILWYLFGLGYHIWCLQAVYDLICFYNQHKSTIWIPKKNQHLFRKFRFLLLLLSDFLSRRLKTEIKTRSYEIICITWHQWNRFLRITLISTV